MLILASGTDADVPSYFVYCDPDEYSTIVSFWWEEIEIDCTVVIGDTVYTNARIRLRGDSSRGYPKKSYRITLSEQQPLDGRIEWNFNSEYLDHTYIHAWLFAWILEQLEYPCFSIDHVRLHVNDTYIGLYIRGEPIDEQFLQDHGMDPDANLYKASVDGACLSMYDDVAGFWEKKANESENWNDLYELIDYLDHVAPHCLHESAGDYFELNRLMTMLAVNSLTLNYSTYYHNYYMYRDIRGSGLWTMLPWDVDKTFGDWISRSYTQGVNPYWYDNTLFEQVLLDSILLELYFSRIGTISEQVLAPAIINPVIDSLETVLASAVEDDILDGITVVEWNDAVLDLRNTRIPGRVAALATQYMGDPRSFRAFRGDTVSLGDKFVRWETCYAPSGGDITYSLYIYTEDGWPYGIYEQYHFLTDTSFTFTALPAGTWMWRVAAISGGRTTEGYDHYNRFTVSDSFTLLSGTLEGTTVLTPNQSPYYVSGDLYIPAGALLIIEDGVDLRFGEGININCAGEISCRGNTADSVRFIADNESEPWGGIRIAGGEAEFLFTVFSGSAGYGGASQDNACIMTENTELTFENCYFRNNHRCINMTGGTILMDSCDLTGWNSGEIFFMGGGSSANIQNSSFGNMVNPPTSYHDGVEFQDCRTGEYLVKNCEVFNIDGDAFDSNSSNLILEGNRVWNVTDKGFSIGINAIGSSISDVDLIGNIVYGCYTGIAVKDDSYADITGCTISECDIGVRAYNKTSGSGGGIVSVTNSILHANSSVFSFEDGSVATVSYSMTGSSEPWTGEGNIAGDPGFADWGSWYLSYDSPCIDTGSPLITDPDGTRSDMGAIFFPQVFDGLVINEIQSINDTTIADSYGEYDDWFEIYNGTGYDCDLSWLYVSDDPSDLSKYQFHPGTLIRAGGFLVVWADEHPWQNGCHLPFRLFGNGDSLYISRQSAGTERNNPVSLNSDVPRIIDFKCFDAIQPDRSLGRVSDGGSQWSILEFCTPGWSNSIPYTNAGYLQVSSPFPNPVFSGPVAMDITVDAGQTVVSVYDLAGRLVDVILDEYLETGEHRLYWDTLLRGGGYVPTGVYLIHVRHAAGLSESRKIVILNQ